VPGKQDGAALHLQDDEAENRAVQGVASEKEKIVR
jgi:hypothetical protein